jgi:hypothetical protein
MIGAMLSRRFCPKANHNSQAIFTVQKHDGRGLLVSLWENKSVLVTGATGLLGSWMIKWLTGEKADVTCLVRDWVPQSEAITSGLILKRQSGSR